MSKSNLAAAGPLGLSAAFDASSDLDCGLTGQETELQTVFKAFTVRCFKAAVHHEIRNASPLLNLYCGEEALLYAGLSFVAKSDLP